MAKRTSNSNRSLLRGFLFHLHPRTVPAETIRFSLSLGLGGMAATLLLVLFGTGLFQLLMYSPGTESAYQSIRLMYTDIPLGGWVRNIHYWAGNLLVIVACLHLLRVFLTGALGDGRQLNWIIGIVLLFLVLFANFSGYLLPWDQLAYWAVTIFTGMFGYIPLCGTWIMQLLRGGNEVGPFTLANFYAIHVGIIPFCLVLLGIYHFWLIRKAGGLVLVKDSGGTTGKSRVPAVPDLTSREAAVGLGLIGLLFMFAALVDAPLADPANPAMSPNPAKAAWYFLGLQELLMHLHPVIVICVIPVLMLVLLVLLPYCKKCILPPGKWFGGKGGEIKFFGGFGGGACATLLLVILDDFLIRSSGVHQGGAGIWLRGIVPLLLFLVMIVLLSWFLLGKLRLSSTDATLVSAGIIVGTLISLTIVGIWFRGPGMQLVFFIS